MFYFIELVRCGQARGSRAHDRDSLAGSELGRVRFDPAVVEGVVDDGALDVLDGDGRLVDAEHAGALARRGTHAPRELGEVVGLGQLVQRLAPVATCRMQMQKRLA